MTRPIFIISTPRTGSTLLQRILASHPKISSTPEPYILLPFIYAFKNEGVFAHYHQPHLVKGLTEFCDYLPDKKGTYFKEIKGAIISMYRQASGNNMFFLDKTPGYCLIVDDIIELFPDAKFVFLVRNPIAALASAIELWGFGHWRLFPVYDSFVTGLRNILVSLEKHRDKICLVHFEQMTKQPEFEIRRITDYLGIQYDPQMVSGFTKVDFKGRMGDPTAGQYTQISKAPIAKWKKAMNTPLRKAWLRNYFKTIGSDRLKAIGYNPQDLLTELGTEQTDIMKCIDDIFEISRDMAKVKLKHLIFKRTARYL